MTRIRIRAIAARALVVLVAAASIATSERQEMLGPIEAAESARVELGLLSLEPGADPLTFRGELVIDDPDGQLIGATAQAAYASMTAQPLPGELVLRWGFSGGTADTVRDDPRGDRLNFQDLVSAGGLDGGRFDVGCTTAAPDEPCIIEFEVEVEFEAVDAGAPAEILLDLFFRIDFFVEEGLSRPTVTAELDDGGFEHA